MNSRTLIVAALVAAAVAGIGGGGWWYYQQAAHAEPAKPQPVDYRFVTLDKIIVMLKSDSGGDARYMAVDLVFRSTVENEGKVKEQLPLLKSVAVRALSQLTRERANALNIDDFQKLLDRSYRATFAREARGQPFTEVMVSKLIIE
ncbi:flagellar basal body-associated FliL family protein [Chromobacterium piscinae]|uniref:flagellar basal body-associated FliL family protein n=1 Tax=Chromobacterium piscinae TaxID=686831 RepID=UPI001E5E8146|nr:flagellar basal body-associated FliL family protein [Chromobacterium piscinae]MCD5329514.1 flagellar basal body-associated FliL family protein [Chromobacterium piscinae]